MSTACRLLALGALLSLPGCAGHRFDVNPLSASEVARLVTVREDTAGIRYVYGPTYMESRRLGANIYRTWVHLLAWRKSAGSAEYEHRLDCFVHGLEEFGLCTAADGEGARLHIEETTLTDWEEAHMRPAQSRTSVRVVLPPGYLEARTDRGLDVTVTGAFGEIRLTVPGYYVRAFLAKVAAGDGGS